MLDHSCQTQRHTHAERGLDLYETPIAATAALLKVEQLPELIWEPAVGRGAIAEVLELFGHIVVVSDIKNYGYPHTQVMDFLKVPSLSNWTRPNTIVTNPPFMLAEKFVSHALYLCPRVIMLLRLAFLESERRSSILENAGLARVHVFRKRLPMMNRDGWTGRHANSGMAFAWFVWERGYTGPIEVRRLSWER